MEYWYDEVDDYKWYAFSEYSKPCYLAAPGGSNTDVAPIQTIEFSGGNDGDRLLLITEGSAPSYMLLCQLWRNASLYQKIPVKVKKTYEDLSESTEALYSTTVSDYYSNQEKLSAYCDSLIPTVSSGSNRSTSKALLSTDLYYSTESNRAMYVSPYTTGISLIIEWK